MNDRLATENWLFSASIYAVCVFRSFFCCNLFVSNFCFYFKYCITFGELIVNLVEVCFNVFAMNDANSNDLIF